MLSLDDRSNTTDCLLADVEQTWDPRGYKHTYTISVSAGCHWRRMGCIGGGDLLATVNGGKWGYNGFCGRLNVFQ